MIVVLGSANMDRMIYVDHFPRIGETSIAHYEIMHSGGKGANQAICAKKVGSEVYFFGSVGQDKAGNMLLENFQTYGIDVHGIDVNTSRLSGVAYITVDHSADNTILYVPGANLEAKASQVDDCFLTEETTVLLQMEISPAENWKLIYRAKERGARVILNAAPVTHVPEEIISHLDVLVMNTTEALMLADNLDIPSEDFDEIAKIISGRYKNTCIITLGKEGVLAVTPHDYIKLPSIDVTALDTTSAGDALIGTFASYYDQGYPFKSCLMAGNIAGGLTAARCGAQESLPTAEEIKLVFKGYSEQRNLCC